MTRNATGERRHPAGLRADGGEPVLRRTPFYPRQAALDAEFYDSEGWAGVYWYGQNEPLAEEYDVPAGVDESPAVGAEHLATRAHGGIYDLTPSTPIELRGPGVHEFVQELFTNDMSMPVGGARYTCMLNEEGGILSDLVVTRPTEGSYLGMTAYGPPGDRHAEWMRSHAPPEVAVINRDSAYASLGVWGPDALEAIQPLTGTELSGEGFPYFTLEEIELAGIPTLAVRVSYVGEYGWEFWVPTEYGPQLWEAVWSAAEPHGIVGMGDGAIMSLAAEKGYRIWGLDITEAHDPYAARLEHTVDLSTEFVGKAALERVREDGGPSRRITCITVDDPMVRPEVGDAILADGSEIGAVVRSDYGYTVGRSIVYAHLPGEHSEPDRSLTIELDSGEVAATTREEPLFDPEHERML